MHAIFYINTDLDPDLDTTHRLDTSYLAMMELYFSGNKFLSICRLQTNLSAVKNVSEHLPPKRSPAHHMRLHSGEKPHRCPQCDMTFSRKDMFSRHEQKVHIKSLKCGRCNQCFALKSLFIRHMRTHTGERAYHCEVCGKLLNSLQCHMAVHSKERPYSCSQCEKTYKTKGDLRKHMHTQM